MESMTTCESLREEFSKVRREYFKENARFCRRCKTTKHKIHLHHIRSLMDGGTNDFENLAPLCSTCHSEWHKFFESYVTFDEFLEIPNVKGLIAVWRLLDVEQYQELTPRQLKELSLKAWELFNVWKNSDEYEPYDASAD